MSRGGKRAGAGRPSAGGAVLTVKCSPEEKEAWKQAAQAAGHRTLSAWVSLVLNGAASVAR